MTATLVLFLKLVFLHLDKHRMKKDQREGCYDVKDTIDSKSNYRRCK